MLPQGPQIAKIVYYLTLWVIYEKLVDCSLFSLIFIYLLCDEVFTRWYLIPTNGFYKTVSQDTPNMNAIFYMYIYIYTKLESMVQ